MSPPSTARKSRSGDRREVLPADVRTLITELLRTAAHIDALLALRHAAPEPCTLSEIAEAAGLPPGSVAHRCAEELVAAGARVPAPRHGCLPLRAVHARAGMPRGPARGLLPPPARARVADRLPAPGDRAGERPVSTSCAAAAEDGAEGELTARSTHTQGAGSARGGMESHASTARLPCGGPLLGGPDRSRSPRWCSWSRRSGSRSAAPPVTVWSSA